MKARICVIRQGFYPLDPRVRREVLALEGAGHEVDVVCLRRPDEPGWERIGNVTVHRISIASRGGGKARYRLTLYTPAHSAKEPPPKDYMARIKRYQPKPMSRAAAKAFDKDWRGER